MKKVNLILAIVFFAVVLSQAQPVEEKQIVFGSDVEEGDMFGNAVCISEDYAFIGAFLDDDNGEFAGAVYVYYNNNGTWEEQQKLIGSDTEYGDSFGASVSVYGDYAIISSELEDDGAEDTGAAYIFYNNEGTWEEVAKLTAPDASIYARFGTSVSIDGDYAIVGASQDGDGTVYDSPGAAYIFYNNAGTWEFHTKLIASDAETMTHFGSSVDIHGAYAVVGSVYDHLISSDEGSAYVFYNNAGTWEEVAKLTADDPQQNDEFGKSVGIHDDFIIVGMYGDDDFSGSAYLFQNNSGTWEQHSKIYAEDASFIANFGWSVDIYEDYAIVGAWGDNDVDYDNGAVYIFTYEDDTWSQEVKILPSDAGYRSSFRYCVSIFGENAVSGAFWNQTLGEDAGAAYFLGPLETNINTINENNITIYPNPTSDKINFDFANNDILQINISDITGKTIISKTEVQQNETIDLSNFENGIYFINIQTTNEIFTTKIIKN